MPSYNESFPRVTLEAMAFGRPIVAFDAWGVREQLQDSLHALLVPPGDRERLTEALRRLLTQPYEAAEMAARARERLASEFTIEKMIGPYIELFRELAGEDIVGNTDIIQVESEAVNSISEALREGTRSGLKRARRGVRTLESGSTEILLVLKALREQFTDSAGLTKGLTDDYLALFVRILRENPGLRLAGVQGLLDSLRLASVNFRELNLENIIVESADFDGSRFDATSLNCAIIKNLVAPGSEWRNSSAILAQFFYCSLNNAVFSSCAMNGAAFFSTELIRAEFERCEMRYTYFKDCLIGKGTFRESDLSRAIFHRCHLEQAAFVDCDLPRASLIDCISDSATSRVVRTIAACRSFSFVGERLWMSTVRVGNGA